MKQMEKAKIQYDSIPIPPELYTRVQKAIDETSSNKKSNIIQLKTGAVKENTEEKKRKHFAYKRMNKGILAAAAFMAIFVTALNTNTAFAREMEKLPVVGPVARILTFRSYVEESEDMTISVEIPSVEMIAEDTGTLTKSVNKMVYEFCQQYAQEAKKRAEDYKEAFLATGGTEEEWKAHNIQIRVWYEIKSQTSDYLSFVVTGAENWNSGSSERRFYNIDLAEEKAVTLENILGGNYKAVADASIRDQMEKMEAEGTIQFWSPEENGFAGIDDNARFYMNDKGNPVIVFEKYEIAPGAYGEIEFEITH